MSSSTICKNFVQNAWKKELCSNCFKSKDDHFRNQQAKEKVKEVLPEPKTKNFTENLSKSIIKTGKKSPDRRVSFPGDLCKVIGYGGDDWFVSSDEEDSVVDSEQVEEQKTESVEEQEARKKLELLTKNNTDLNVNLGPCKKLQLGKPLVDSSGRKQTLQVSVTPFGQKKNGSRIVEIPVVKQYLAKNAEKSLLDEIDETLKEKKLTTDDATPQQQQTTVEKPEVTAEVKTYENLITSRELAGEPDGSSACDEDKDSASGGSAEEAPVITPEKPKVPNKPSTILIRKPYVMNTVNKVILSTFHVDKTPLTRRDSSGSDSGKKRKAPKPPNEESTTIYTRKNLINSNSDCPVVREKEKRERASGNSTKKDSVPEPAPRHSLSVSTDSLNELSDKKKRNRFSLKKFLRMGGGTNLRDSCESIAPLPKPRLVIVHPTDLAQVEAPKQRPPPPPRAPSGNPPTVPVQNLPPKSVEVKELQSNSSNVQTVKPTDSVYANIGEVRMAIAPNKPQRTASMRERDAKRGFDDHHYEYVNGNGNNSNRSSSPEYDSYEGQGRAGKPSMPRSSSLTYCGSETESEIYAPYCYYGSESEQVADDDWGHEGRIYNKLRHKKGRSIVHRNLEDNYGAVVVANHEALAQVLDNIQQNYIHNQNPVLRAIKTADNLRWTSFILKNSPACAVGPCAFHEAYWNSQAVVLMVTTNHKLTSSASLSLGTFQLNPVTEFSDLVPVEFTCNNYKDITKVQATVAVLPHVQVDSIQSAAEALRNRNEHKDSVFLLLQLVNALKTLQAQGIEDLPANLNSFILSKDIDKVDFCRKLHVLQGLGEDSANKTNATLCSIMSTVLGSLPIETALAALIKEILQSERAVSLSQVKSILEFSLWGPSDVTLGPTSQEREVALQRWLDLQRATVLHGLVCTKVQLTVYEECHLLFLVRSNAKIMREASILLDSIKKA